MKLLLSVFLFFIYFSSSIVFANERSFNCQDELKTLILNGYTIYGKGKVENIEFWDELSIKEKAQYEFNSYYECSVRFEGSVNGESVSKLAKYGSFASHKKIHGINFSKSLSKEFVQVLSNAKDNTQFESSDNNIYKSNHCELGLRLINNSEPYTDLNLVKENQLNEDVVQCVTEGKKKKYNGTTSVQLIYLYSDKSKDYAIQSDEPLGYAKAKEKAKKDKEEHDKNVQLWSNKAKAHCNTVVKEIQSKYNITNLVPVTRSVGINKSTVQCVMQGTMITTSGNIPKQLVVLYNHVNGSYEISN
jgi:hypothetical protein